MNIINVGSFLKRCRKNLGVTQGYVAEHLNVSAQAVSKWERGENLPDVALFPALSRVLQVSINDILQAGTHEGGSDDQNAQTDELRTPIVNQDAFEKILARVGAGCLVAD